MRMARHWNKHCMHKESSVEKDRDVQFMDIVVNGMRISVHAKACHLLLKVPPDAEFYGGFDGGGPVCWGALYWLLNRRN